MRHIWTVSFEGNRVANNLFVAYCCDDLLFFNVSQMFSLKICHCPSYGIVLISLCPLVRSNHISAYVAFWTFVFNTLLTF